MILKKLPDTINGNNNKTWIKNDFFAFTFKQALVLPWNSKFLY